MEKIVGIKFNGSNKVYSFAPGKDKYEKGTEVIVETARGLEFAYVAYPEKEVDKSEIVQPLRPIVRIATAKDKATYAENEKKRPAALKTAQEKIEKHKLNMKLVDCEFTFDGSKVVFYFTADGRIDFRELVKDLAGVFHIRIELRQIGIRDETKLLGGIAPCGRECCCASCMPEFRKVSIKMAKTQGLSLNPTKISGLCGRLMCCLSYENSYYSEVYKTLPKIGSTVGSADGNGIVVSTNMLKKEVRLKIENSDGSLVYKDFPVGELKFKRCKGCESDDDDGGDDEIKEILD